MGVAPYKTFTFDGVSSSAYGVYLTGEGVFNAPVRSVEMIAIPGRNGDYALDQGKFEDISVTYKIGMFDVNESNFADKVSAFRNWLCSKVGYVRLSDDYNPNEYRMAVYANGLELDHKFLIAGEATITFTCKPQRWLTSGETAVAVADGGTLNNPTLFNSEPLLEVKGYGRIEFNGYSIEIENNPVGDITLVGSEKYTLPITLDLANVQNGDDVSIDLNYINTSVQFENVPNISNYFSYVSNSMSVTDSNSNFTTAYAGNGSGGSGTGIQLVMLRTTVDEFNVQKGTNKTETNTVSGTFQCKVNGTTYTVTLSVTQTIAYDGTTHTITMTGSGTATSSIPSPITSSVSKVTFFINYIIAHSTASLTSDTVNIDCDIGECWTEKNGVIVTLNDVVAFGSDLPKLASGTNTFTYDNTITSFKVVPRWWKV